MRKGHITNSGAKISRNEESQVEGQKERGRKRDEGNCRAEKESLIKVSLTQKKRCRQEIRNKREPEYSRGTHPQSDQTLPYKSVLPRGPIWTKRGS